MVSHAIRRYNADKQFQIYLIKRNICFRKIRSIGRCDRWLFGYFGCGLNSRVSRRLFRWGFNVLFACGKRYQQQYRKNNRNDSFHSVLRIIISFIIAQFSFIYNMLNCFAKSVLSIAKCSIQYLFSTALYPVMRSTRFLIGRPFI